MATYCIGYAYPMSEVGGVDGGFYVETAEGVELFSSYACAKAYASTLQMTPSFWSMDHPAQEVYKLSHGGLA